jgi:hypothetical protein
MQGSREKIASVGKGTATCEGRAAATAMQLQGCGAYGKKTGIQRAACVRHDFAMFSTARGLSAGSWHLLLSHTLFAVCLQQHCSALYKK